MKILRALLLQKHWLNKRLFFSSLRDFFSAMGFIWTIIKIVSFFGNPALEQALKSWLPFYVAACVLYMLVKNFPRSAYSFRIRGRDSWIELRIGDVFRCKGDIVVPFNDRFDASLNGKAAIAPTVQGSLIRSQYNGDAEKLQAAIDSAISERKVSPEGSVPGTYKLGTVVPVKTRQGTAYLFASSVLKENNRVRGNAEDLAHILPDLFDYIKNEGDKCNVIVPAIGTGHARTVLCREETVELLVKNFIDSCRGSTYCNKLVVMLHPDDVVKHKIDVQYLVRYIQSYCEFARFDEPITEAS